MGHLFASLCLVAAAARIVQLGTEMHF